MEVDGMFASGGAATFLDKQRVNSTSMFVSQSVGAPKAIGDRIHSVCYLEG